MRAVAREIGLALDGPKIVVSKSTVPVETGELVSSIIREHARADHAVSVVSNPEFLREGSAVADFLKPDRVVIGTDDPEAEAVLRDLYAPLDAPIVVTDVRTSEMIKYAANAFLATKISFINEIANICELLDVDVRAVCRGIGYDQRIGTKFLNPGIGYGGSCFPKDVRALEQLAVEHDYPAPLLHAVELVNRRQVERTVVKLERELGGLHGRVDRGAGPGVQAEHRRHPRRARARDHPAAARPRRGRARARSDRERSGRQSSATASRSATDMYATVEGADAVLLATEWNEFRMLDFERCAAAMRGDLVVDGRNIFDPEKVRAAGLRYLGVGRVKLARPNPRRDGVRERDHAVDDTDLNESSVRRSPASSATAGSQPSSSRASVMSGGGAPDRRRERPVDSAQLDARERAIERGELADRVLARVADIDHASGEPGPRREAHEPVDKIVDVAEAARLRAVAVHGQRLAAQRGDAEVGDHAAVAGLHPRAVRVEDARDAPVDARACAPRS